MAKIPSVVVAVPRLVPSTLTVALPSGMRWSESKTTPLIADIAGRAAAGAESAGAAAAFFVVSLLAESALTGGLRCWAASALEADANASIAIAKAGATKRGRETGRRNDRLLLTANQMEGVAAPGTGSTTNGPHPGRRVPGTGTTRERAHPGSAVARRLSRTHNVSRNRADDNTAPVPRMHDVRTAHALRKLGGRPVFLSGDGRRDETPPVQTPSGVTPLP